MIGALSHGVRTQLLQLAQIRDPGGQGPLGGTKDPSTKVPVANHGAVFNEGYARHSRLLIFFKALYYNYYSGMHC